MARELGSRHVVPTGKSKMCARLGTPPKNVCAASTGNRCIQIFAKKCNKTAAFSFVVQKLIHCISKSKTEFRETNLHGVQLEELTEYFCSAMQLCFI
jgi:hypothetical protein